MTFVILAFSTQLLARNLLGIRRDENNFSYISPMEFQPEWWHYGLAMLVGLGASFINSLAGGGSVLSLPLFILMGLPQAAAHGTNRLGLIPGALISSRTLRKKEPVELRLFFKLMIPVILGTAVGTQVVIDTPDRIYNPILAAVLVVVAFATPVRSSTVKQQSSREDVFKVAKPEVFVWFLLLGLYAGFIQVGAGILMMYIFHRCLNFSTFQVNALKGAIGAFFLGLSVVILGVQGMVHWALACFFGLGSYCGGWLGAKWQLRRGVDWVRWVLRVMGVALAVKLLLASIG